MLLEGLDLLVSLVAAALDLFAELVEAFLQGAEFGNGLIEFWHRPSIWRKMGRSAESSTFSPTMPLLHVALG